MTIREIRVDGTTRVADGPSTLLQEMLFTSMSANPGENRAFNVENVHTIRGPLDVAALARAVDLVVERHESLRSVFVPGPGGVRLRTLPAPTGALIQYGRTGAGSPSPAEVDTAVRADAEHLFDLAHERPSRFTLHRIDEDEHVLVVVVHHLVLDGWSMGVLLDDLATAYEAVRVGRSPFHGRLPCRLTDFARHQRALIASADVVPLLDFWARQLAGLQDGSTVPYDRPARPYQTFAGDRLDFELPAALAGGVRDVARTERVTVTAVALLAYQILLREYTGQEDVVVGVPTANRSRPGTQDCVGLLMNTHCVRMGLPDRAPLRDLLHSSARTLTAALRHQEVPLVTVYEDLIARYGADNLPPYLFRTLFICHTHRVGPLTLEGTVCERRPFSQHASKADITLNVWPDDSGIRCQIEYNTDLYDAATIHQVADRYQALMSRIVNDLVW
ncbi:condensation domain-containing protein [Streptomyces sp. KMM 9044]|uniref:condensation domain-containing protein n=1 Tax=Streptomyces sp. KMM 9044 TaxID=2744474 RepID=UPI002151922B|nr:condensation domain-containing protein [Streptomyces sp. KMM 9044]WAX76549.1 condensation domain-containing protein [Streptomyces sp. KMM 9044]